MTHSEPSFQALMTGRHRATLPSELAARLRELAERRETEALRGEIEAALVCPWWGLRVLAIQAIGRWGGERNRAWLVERARRRLPSFRELRKLRHGDALRWLHDETVAARVAVAPTLGQDDAGWVLDIWFENFNLFTGLHAALPCLPGAIVEARIGQEIATGERERLEAATWLVFNLRELDGRAAIMRRLAASADEYIVKQARRLLSHIAAEPAAT